MIAAARSLKRGMERVQQPQCIHMTVGGTEACACHLRPDLRQHPCDLAVIEDLIIEAFHSGLVVQALEPIGAGFHLALGKQEVQAAGSAKTHVETGLVLDRLCKLRPTLR